VANEPLQEQDEAPPFAVTCPEGQHLDPETETCVPDTLDPITVEAPEINAPATVEALKLGEPFDAYDSMEDCIAKNSEKDDPAGYCAEIQNRAEETSKIKVMTSDTYSGNKIEDSGVRFKKLHRTMEKLNLEHTHQHEDIDGKFKKLGEALDCNNATFKAVKTGIQSLRKQQRRIAGKVNEVINRPEPAPVDFTPILDAINETRTTLNKQVVDLARNGAVIQKSTSTSLRTMNNQLKVLESALKTHLVKIQTVEKSTATLPILTSQINTLTDATKNLPQLSTQVTTLTEKLEAQEKKLTEKDGVIEELKTKLEEETKNKVKETADLKTLVENNAEMIKTLSVFKGTQKNVVEQQEPDVQPAWKQGGP
jgi:hypothetical protein